MTAALTGIRIAVTRARAQADELATPLRTHGADVLVAPLIRIAPFRESEAVAATVGNLGGYDWIVFSSANGVEVFCDALRRARISTDRLAALRVACVGPATAAEAARQGITTDLIPAEYVGEALARALVERVGGRGARVLLARAAGARQQLAHDLKAHGALVTDLELYESVPDEEGVAVLRERVGTGTLDVLTFTSGSTVRYFSAAVGRTGGAEVAVIGPVTAQIAREHGLNVSIEADPHTVAGLVDGIIGHFSRARPRAVED